MLYKNITINIFNFRIPKNFFEVQKHITINIFKKLQKTYEKKKNNFIIKKKKKKYN